jgi:uncharacterized Zn finger protein
MSPSRTYDWERFPPSQPRQVDGGLRARSTRGAIGQRWWSRRFVEVLESFALGTRLTRGRNYARRGQVLEIAVTSGKVTASVQGSRRKPYAVTIGLPPFDLLLWAKVEITLAEQAIHSAQLLAGEFPPDLEEVFAALDAPLFPTQAADMQMACSCPDHEVPCKHISATFYLLAERFDDDPFLILQWRGREREALLARLRELRSGGAAEEIVAESSPPPMLGAAAVLADLSPIADAGFWGSAQLPPLPVTPELPVDLLLRQLPVPSRELGGERLATQLQAVYALLAGGAALGDVTAIGSEKQPSGAKH